jgi:hypothetical protein
MGDLITATGKAIDIARKLYDLDSVARDAQAKLLIADLQNELAGVKSEVANLKEQLAEATRKIAILSGGESEPFTRKWGCLVFEGDPELYCPNCYQTKRQKHMTNRVDSKMRICTVCDKPIPV